MAVPAAAVAAFKKLAADRLKKHLPQKPSRWWVWCLAILVPIVMIAALALQSMTVAVMGIFGSDSGANPEVIAPASCTAQIDGTLPGLTVDASGLPQLENVTTRQAQVATTIIAAIAQAGGDRKATVIALMVAAQESTMGDNPAITQPNGDGDVGVFQQRAKPGWYADGATIEENTAILSDPSYAATVFYKGHTVAKEYPDGAGPKGYHIPGLVDIDGWEDMALTVAAQNVQRSAFGDAYAKWEAYANLLYDTYLPSAGNATPSGPGGAAGSMSTTGDASTLCGPGTYMQCASDPGVQTQLQGVLPDTLLVALCAKQHFPKLTTFYGVRADSLPYHPSGRAVDLMVSGIFSDVQSEDAIKFGDDIAAYLQQNAEALGVDHLIWRQHIWSTARAGEGWRPMEDRGGITENHFDHVHVTTFGNKSTTGPQTLDPNGQPTVAPIKRGSYVIGPSWGAVGSWARYHTGQDFAAATGTPVFAVQDGVISDSLSGTSSWCGIHVALTINGGDSLLYCHLSAALVKPGDRVQIGQQIGLVGSTGRSTGPHLHFEHYRVGITPGDVYKSDDPMAWLKAHGADVATS